MLDRKNGRDKKPKGRNYRALFWNNMYYISLNHCHIIKFSIVDERKIGTFDYSLGYLLILGMSVSFSSGEVTLGGLPGPRGARLLFPVGAWYCLGKASLV